MSFKAVVPCSCGSGLVACPSHFGSFGGGLDDVQPLTAQTMLTGDDWIDNIQSSLQQCQLLGSSEETFFTGENSKSKPEQEDEDEDIEEKIIQGLIKEEAEKNKNKKMKKKVKLEEEEADGYGKQTKINLKTSIYRHQFETRKRDKIDGRIAQLEKLIISSGNQTNKELDGVFDHLKMMKAQIMNGTNYNPLPQPQPAEIIQPSVIDPFKRFLLCQSWPMTHEKFEQTVQFYLRM